ncbi:xylose isomerase [Chroococcidiopsis sp. CCALA 051]|uniref:metabolite traffic protein EboE n=1 Tax=Chroococcidiopsis sp. CCALA 051 TaxID=869949 RepID=UPI000D0CE35F|nr:metabolite traffic protein EboE [Chroococcidiopsis sp. CCALA 051]PSM46498.1 xylose isomerase [Chroococcidiopsis sp. CCALA 051]
MKIDRNLHLTYCTNIHPGEGWNQVFANLQQYIPALKQRLAPEKPFGIGLRLADVAARELLVENNLIELRSWLRDRNLYVFTLNGFPYGGFHHQVVKDRVYAPDWSMLERLNYTLRLTRILAELLPDGIDGGISTLPLSYKPWFEENSTTRAFVYRIASIHIAQVVAEMVRVRAETGKLLHLDLEPEPDGLVENSAEVINYFQTQLLPVGGRYLAKQLGTSLAAAETHLLEHVRICYDTCHFAVEYEEPATVFQRFRAAGIQIGKIQLSSALQLIVPEPAAQRRQVVEKLRPFAESTYLHQAIARDRNGKLYRYSDLVTALPDLEQIPACELRIHFHVPIFIRDYQFLQSTQDHIKTVLELLQRERICSCLEIETYTWDVLPEDMKLDLVSSIQREYESVVSYQLSVKKGCGV